MRVLFRRLFLIWLAASALLLSGCGKDFNGFGEEEGWGGYTREFGNIDGYGDKQVGLCTYTGGCMQEGATGASGIGPSRAESVDTDHGAGDHGAVDNGGVGE